MSRRSPFRNLWVGVEVAVSAHALARWRARVNGADDRAAVLAAFRRSKPALRLDRERLLRKGIKGLRRRTRTCASVRGGRVEFVAARLDRADGTFRVVVRTVLVKGHQPVEGGVRVGNDGKPYRRPAGGKHARRPGGPPEDFEGGA